MNAQQLVEYLVNQQPLLLDVREPWEFEICHLEDSINIPMGQIPSSLKQIESAQECVIICHHGVRSTQVIQYLQQQGIEALINLDGGIDEWAREVDQEMAVY